MPMPLPDLKQDRSSLALAINISMLVLAFLAVGLRLISRRLSVLNYWWDDLLAIISLVRIIATLYHAAHADSDAGCVHWKLCHRFFG